MKNESFFRWSESVLFRVRRKHNCLVLQLQLVIGITDCGVYGYIGRLLLVFQVCLFGHYFWALFCKHCVEYSASFFRVCGSSVI